MDTAILIILIILCTLALYFILSKAMKDPK